MNREASYDIRSLNHAPEARQSFEDLLWEAQRLDPEREHRPGSQDVVQYKVKQIRGLAYRLQDIDVRCQQHRERWMQSFQDSCRMLEGLERQMEYDMAKLDWMSLCDTFPGISVGGDGITGAANGTEMERRPESVVREEVRHRGS